MIIVRLTGGMGNQMFEYALGRALSIKNNDAPFGLDLAQLLDRTPRPESHNFVFRDYDLDVFTISENIVPQSQIPFSRRWFFSGTLMLYINAARKRIFSKKGIEKDFKYDPTIMNVGTDIYLEGYWQSPKYFKDIEETIRKDFSLKNELSEHSATLKKEIEAHNSLCINVRRADFVKSNFHGTFESAYYDEAVKKMSERESIDKVYVFSDDIKWCKEHLHFTLPTMYVGYEYKGKKFEEYLYLMAACKHFIIPNSSFAWWGAWLSLNKDKTVIVPKRWFLDESIHTDDLIPSEWIRI